MKAHSIIAIALLALAPLANAQQMDQVFVRAVSQSAEETIDAKQMDALETNSTVESVTRDLDQMLQERLNFDVEAPQHAAPTDVLLVSN
ncbi:MAG: hypothetical protein ACK5HY_12025 [Parahaliea sp.]